MPGPWSTGERSGGGYAAKARHEAPEASYDRATERPSNPRRAAPRAVSSSRALGQNGSATQVAHGVNGRCQARVSRRGLMLGDRCNQSTWNPFNTRPAPAVPLKCLRAFALSSFLFLTVRFIRRFVLLRSSPSPYFFSLAFFVASAQFFVTIARSLWSACRGANNVGGCQSADEISVRDDCIQTRVPMA